MRCLYIVLRCQRDGQAQATMRDRADTVVRTLTADPRLAHSEMSAGYLLSGEPGMPTLDHVVLRAWSDDPHALNDVAAAIDTVSSQALERWDLVVQPTRVQGRLGSFAPDTSGARPLGADEPVVVHIQSAVAPHGAAPFYEAGPVVAAQALAHPGYLGGLGLTDTFADIASLSCWRTYSDAHDYALRDGPHDRARRQSHRDQWALPATECYMRLRPLASTGTLQGSNPFDALPPCASLTK